MVHLEKKGEYAVILEPEGMSVSADHGWVERVEELIGKGSRSKPSVHPYPKAGPDPRAPCLFVHLLAVGGKHRPSTAP